MTNILMINSPQSPLSALARGFEACTGVELSLAETGSQALDMAAGQSYQLVVAQSELADMSGVEFLNKLLQVNPMLNTALTSSLDHAQFHEATEGLGVLMALPLHPEEKYAAILLEKLKQVHGLLDQ